MNGPGFDWLDVPSSSEHSGTSSPAPPVSFGSNSNSTLQSNIPNRSTEHILGFRNSSADQLTSGRVRNHSTLSLGVNFPIQDEESVPLSLTAQELTLEETKTYMRWYSDILARTKSRTITMNDVFTFLNNFRIPNAYKEKINKICQKILHSINIGEFFAVLRLISHAMNGIEPRRTLIKVQSPVPSPTPILSKKRHNEDDLEVPEEKIDPDEEEKKPLDLDSFTRFMLTGQRPDEEIRKGKSKKLKSVKFSDQIVTDIHDDTFTSPIASPSPSGEIDYSLPMDQLLDRMKIQSSPSQGQYQSHQDEDEKEILKDMESQINHFQNLNSVDTASIDGVPANLDFNKSDNNFLRPNLTGPAQMAQMFSPSPEPQTQQLKPNMTGPNQIQQARDSPYERLSHLHPNLTGPDDMARLFASRDDSQDLPRISLQSFTDQMTGNTQNNTMQNSQIRTTNDGSPMRPSLDANQPLPPPPRRNRSVSSPIYPIANNELKIAWPSGTSSPSNGNGKHLKPPPPPPPSRRRGNGTSTPPIPPKKPLYANDARSDSTGNLLDDLKALQEEVDRIRDMTGGF